MKVKLIYYSHFGYTKLVSEQISERLKFRGFDVYESRLEIVDPLNYRDNLAVTIEVPSIEGFDLIILGTPVHDGRMSGAMRYYIEQITSFHKKKLIIVVTYLYRRGWGAVQTIEDIRKHCETKGAVFLASTDIQWTPVFKKWKIGQSLEKIERSLDLYASLNKL
ncbi:MAG: flavodoxin family protein [Brevefilum sp.]